MCNVIKNTKLRNGYKQFYRWIIWGVLSYTVALGLCIITTKKNFVPVSAPNDLHTYSNSIVYFGRETCSSCNLAEEVIIPILKKRNTKIFYFNTDDLRDFSSFQSVLDEYNVTEIPMLVKISEGTYVAGIKLMDDGRIDPSKIEKFLDEEIYNE